MLRSRIDYAVPGRMARALHRAFKRDGLECHARKLAFMDELFDDEARGLIPLTAGEGAIYARADQSARECYALLAGYGGEADAPAMRAGVRAICKRSGIAYPVAIDDAQAWARAVDPAWWLRSLRREWARRFELASIRLGFVGAGIDPYITRESGNRQARRNEANAKLLRETDIVNVETKETLNLAQAAQAGMGNKVNRRNELMTRIRGFQEVAEELGHKALFATFTTPSKYHAVGGKNAKYAGASPRDAQAYLAKVWARMRAALARVGIEIYGFRVAEPHTDGCPHWHLLVFVAPDRMRELKRIIVRYALAEDGDEAGARKQRVKLVAMDDRGSAAGYIAKYIAKNIDGVGVDGESIGKHRAYAESEDGQVRLRELSQEVLAGSYGGRELSPSERVCYWAQIWGIRQFQQVGGAPVGVWRELRRVEEKEIEAAPAVVREAWEAVQKREGKDEAGNPVTIQADWRRYVMAQGGPGCGRDAVVKLWKKEVRIDGRYGRHEVEKPCGIYVGTWTAASLRYEWKRVEAGAVALPWTRVNNCTQNGAPAVAVTLSAGNQYELRGAEWVSTGKPSGVPGTIPGASPHGRWHSPRVVPRELEKNSFSAVDVAAEVKAGRRGAWDGSRIDPRYGFYGEEPERLATFKRAKGLQ